MREIHAALIAAESRIDQESAEMLAPPSEGPAAEAFTSGQRRMLDDTAKQLSARRLSEFRANVLADTDRNRQELLRQLAAAYDRLDLAVRATPSPVAMLGMEGLGSDSRQRYETQLATAGPATIANAAVRAIASNDLVLAAAVLSRLDAIPRDQRPFQPVDLAEKLVGKRHKLLIDRHERCRLALDAARSAEKYLTTGKLDSQSKISRGIAVRRLASIANREAA
jgi:hypothetical protein